MKMSEKLKCVVVDDELIARRGMARMISRRPELELVASCEDADSAVKCVETEAPDILFLDIEMPGMNGLDLARQIPKSTLVIFTTAYSEYAAESYYVEALDYLMKPIDPVRFDKAVDKAIEYHMILRDKLAGEGTPLGDSDSVESGNPSPSSDFIWVKSDRRYVRVNIADILFVEGLKDYVIIRMADRNVITRMTIKNMLEMLPGATFIRSAKSYIINRDKVDAFDNNDIFIGQYELAIGAAYRDSVLTALFDTKG